VNEDDVLSLALKETEGLEHMINAIGCEGEIDAEMSGGTEPIFVSTLWSGLSSSEKMELAQASAAPEVVESMHNVRPTTRSVTSYKKRDPLIVSFKLG
jgi:hypothetical protein